MSYRKLFGGVPKAHWARTEDEAWCGSRRGNFAERPADVNCPECINIEARKEIYFPELYKRKNPRKQRTCRVWAKKWVLPKKKLYGAAAMAKKGILMGAAKRAKYRAFKKRKNPLLTTPDPIYIKSRNLNKNMRVKLDGHENTFWSPRVTVHENPGGLARAHAAGAKTCIVNVCGYQVEGVIIGEKLKAVEYVDHGKVRRMGYEPEPGVPWRHDYKGGIVVGLPDGSVLLTKR